MALPRMLTHARHWFHLMNLNNMGISVQRTKRKTYFRLFILFMKGKVKLVRWGIGTYQWHWWLKRVLLLCPGCLETLQFTFSCLQTGLITTGDNRLWCNSNLCTLPSLCCVFSHGLHAECWVPAGNIHCLGGWETICDQSCMKFHRNGSSTLTIRI